MDALDVVNIKKQQSRIKGRITITDLASNSYPPIDISEINISSNFNGELPIYQLFTWQHNCEAK